MTQFNWRLKTIPTVKALVVTGPTGPQGVPGGDGLLAEDLLAASTRNTHPESPQVLWADTPGYVARWSPPASGVASVMNDDYLMYDNQTMVD